MYSKPDHVPQIPAINVLWSLEGLRAQVFRLHISQIIQSPGRRVSVLDSSAYRKFCTECR